MIVRPPLLRAAAWPAVVLGVYLVARAALGRAVSWGPCNVAFHIAGGVAIAHLAEVAMAPVLAELRGRTRRLVRAVGVFTITSTTAAWWEFFECVMARLYHVRGPSAGGDTLRDIAAGMTGAVAWLAVTRLARSRDSLSHAS